jgi:hypothetical protein
VILECRDQGDLSGKNVPLSAAFEPGFMFVLPGPPGAGDKATPQIYVGRAMQQMILIDPETLAASLTQAKGFNTYASSKILNFGLIAWHDKLFNLSSIWDPRGNTSEKIASPFDAKVNRWGMTIRSDTMYYFDGNILYAGPPGEKPSKLQVGFPSKSDQINYYSGQLNESNLFGLVADGRYQLLLTNPASGLSEPAAQSFATWCQRHVSAISNSPR